MNRLILNLSLKCRTIASLVMILLFFAVSACRANQSGDVLAGENDDTELISLDLVGYNYTNHYIDSYSVDGQAGGNIMVSSPTSGGGKVVCCLMLEKNGPSKIRVAVRWQFGGCIFAIKSAVIGRQSESIYSYYKETEVEVEREIGVKPRNLEVHFYQDGSVKAKITENFSRPQLALNEGRADRTPFARCKNDTKPTK